MLFDVVLIKSQNSLRCWKYFLQAGDYTADDDDDDDDDTIYDLGILRGL